MYKHTSFVATGFWIYDNYNYYLGKSGIVFYNLNEYIQINHNTVENSVLILIWKSYFFSLALEHSLHNS